MKRILVLTSIYPSEDNPRGFTPVVHYFAKEWVKLDYDVKVIHNQTRFPIFFYFIPHIIRAKLESILGFALPVKNMLSEKRSVLDGVGIHRLLIFRIFPFFKFRKKDINKQISKIIRSNDEDGFIPDYIVSHWLFPQLPILAELKILYKCKTSMVFHSVDKIDREYQSILESIDLFGFRSKLIRQSFFDKYGYKENNFLCFSGIDKSVIMQSGTKSFSNTLRKFIFVGNLIKRKHPEVVISSLKTFYDEEPFYLDIIGDGPEKKSIAKLINELNTSTQVKLYGQVDRSQVLQKMSSAECFIMVSNKEVFGLVYVEAMAKGCIVIASKNEGMEGVIINGKNGFLCNAGDKTELTTIIKHINTLSIDEKMKISDNAINTASELTEKKVAEFYVQNLEKLD